MGDLVAEFEKLQSESPIWVTKSVQAQYERIRDGKQTGKDVEEFKTRLDLYRETTAMFVKYKESGVPDVRIEDLMVGNHNLHALRNLAGRLRKVTRVKRKRPEEPEKEPEKKKRVEEEEETLLDALREVCDNQLKWEVFVITGDDKMMCLQRRFTTAERAKAWAELVYPGEKDYKLFRI